MGKFSKIKKYSKPSLEVNEKIEKLNKELEKTGVLFEAPTNSTSGLYGGQDQENTTQNTNIREPGTGTNDIGEPFQGVFGNYDQNASFSYIIVSGAISSQNRGQYVVFDHIRDENNKVLYSIPRLFTLSGDRLHFKSVYISSRLITGLRKWTVNGVTTAGATYELYVGTTGFATGKFRAGLVNEGPTLVKFWSNSVEQPIPGEMRQKPDWYHFMRRDGRSGDGGYGTQDPWEKVKDMLDAGKEWMHRVIGDINPIDAAFRVFENVAKSYGLYGAANTLREYGNFTSGRVSYTPEKPKMTNASTEEKKAILKQAESILFGTDPRLTPTIEGLKNKYYKPPVTEKEKQKARRIIAEALSRSINGPTAKDLYYQHGAVSPTFHKGHSNAEGISSDGSGGLNVNDGYDFAPKEGQTGTENARVPGPAGYVLEMLANAVTYDARNKEYEKKGKGYGSVADLPRMPIRTTFTKEDLKGTSLGQLLDDIGFNNSLKEDRTIKRVSSAIKDSSPILETKTIQTEQKSPARFLVKEKREDTSRSRWLKRA